MKYKKKLNTLVNAVPIRIYLNFYIFRTDLNITKFIECQDYYQDDCQDNCQDDCQDVLNLEIFKSVLNIVKFKSVLNIVKFKYV